MKTCSKCRADKDAICFGKNSQSRDGLRPDCRACRAAHSKLHMQIYLNAPGVKEARAAYAKKRWVEKKAMLGESNKIWREQNRESVRAQVYEWRKNNPEAYHAINAKSRLKHKDRIMVANGKRRALEKRATPAWADMNAMRGFYKRSLELSELLGVPHQVDHTIPLKSKFVCGLHCEANLQVIPASENFKKNNFFWPDMPEKENYVE